MRSLKQKIIIFTTLSVVFLLVHLGGYLYNIRSFRAKLVTLERAHDFMEDVLELRRYEKNFVYEIDPRDIKEVLIYLKKVKREVLEISCSPVEKECSKDVIAFNKHVVRYEKLVRAAQTRGEFHLKKIRHCGQQMVSFAEKVLDVNRRYIDESLKRIMVVPSVVMFLFGGTLIVFLLLLTFTIIRQISFIQQTTERIAQGDFSYIPSSGTKRQTFGLIIKAFNRMIGELETRQEQLLQAKKLASVGTLTSGIAHEVNNPLNNISLTAESILEEFDELSKTECQEMLREILSEVRRASGVVQNLLDFSRRKRSDRFEPLNLGEVIEATLKLIRNQLMLSGIQLRKEIAEDLPLIKGDLDSLKQVFINLFLNAIQAMPGGGVLLVRIPSEKKGLLEVEVSDTGVGMSPEIMDRIFDPFYSTKPVGKGTGLGLSIVYGLVKKHGGYIEVKSRQGEGTTFVLSFPVVK